MTRAYWKREASPVKRMINDGIVPETKGRPALLMALTGLTLDGMKDHLENVKPEGLTAADWFSNEMAFVELMGAQRWRVGPGPVWMLDAQPGGLEPRERLAALWPGLDCEPSPLEGAALRMRNMRGRA